MFLHLHWNISIIFIIFVSRAAATPQRNISPLQSAVQPEVHIITITILTARVEAKWGGNNRVVSPPYSPTLSLSLFLSLPAHSDPGWWWPIPGVSQKSRVAITLWLEGQTFGCTFLKETASLLFNHFHNFLVRRATWRSPVVVVLVGPWRTRRWIPLDCRFKVSLLFSNGLTGYILCLCAWKEKCKSEWIYLIQYSIFHTELYFTIFVLSNHPFEPNAIQVC